MAKIEFSELQNLDGYVAAALVDVESGMLMAGDGSAIYLELSAAGDANVLKTKMKVVDSLGFEDFVEDMLITLSKQYHLIRPLETNSSIFLYLIMDKAKANLAMARYSLRSFEKSVDFS
ncbi:roadblock/LC7 domain-containing protein [Marinobacter halodurans]|uniref:Roadblock/LC7 domain-containing protein n=1 Tax=Marinobacter halodurans TaxID=2528979 RepID=A0ABY1ZP06_9GAMM|nr:roadblock/LC7 domain-containing protein [Marinobacter halodurans]TBW58466.1 roadblock/LC7 domain-containing protein [Marinobacter halodurans]